MTALGDHYVRSAMAGGGITQLDGRGLMPLADARGWLAGIDTYTRGEQIAVVDGSSILESDRTWAALLSLADADEFLTQTRRLSFEFEVRGMENLAPLQRYGDAVLEWISDRIDADGTLHNRPWCLLPCLLACPAPAAFDVAVRVQTVAGSSTMPATASVAARWILRHPEPGYRLLATHPAGPAVLRELHALDPRGTRQALAAAAGAAVADGLLGSLNLVEEPLPTDVLAVLAAAPVLDLGPSLPVSLAELDEKFESFEVPLFDNANYFSAAIRLSGFVVPGGQDGLVFQGLMTGLGQYGAELFIATFGFGAKPGVRWGGSRLIVHEDLAEALQDAPVWPLDLPGGRVEVPVQRHPEFGEELGPLETVMLAITEDTAGRDRTFLRPDQLVDHLKLPEQAVALFTLDSWDHPDAGEPASSSEDLVLAVEALRQRRAITTTVTNRTRDSHLRRRLEFLGGWGGDWPA